MVEFFHPLADGVKIPPCWWRFWTTFIGGIFHLFPLQCTPYPYSFWANHSALDLRKLHNSICDDMYFSLAENGSV